jgi:UDP-N-acetylmuramyl pentapeptide phosphotransferase/UDP-N-acetylglucosamine-1-phosphate transferase
MPTLGNLFIILCAIISILFGLEYFSEASIKFLAFPLYLIGHYMKHNFTYRNFKISRRSKPFFESILKNAIQAIAYVTIFIFVGYILLKISKTDFYLNNLQSLMQGSIDLINEIIRFWINLPSQLMKYGQ